MKTKRQWRNVFTIMKEMIKPRIIYVVKLPISAKMELNYFQTYEISNSWDFCRWTEIYSTWMHRYFKQYFSSLKNQIKICFLFSEMLQSCFDKFSGNISLDIDSNYLATWGSLGLELIFSLSLKYRLILNYPDPLEKFLGRSPSVISLSSGNPDSCHSWFWIIFGVSGKNNIPVQFVEIFSSCSQTSLLSLPCKTGMCLFKEGYNKFDITTFFFTNNNLSSDREIKDNLH